MIYGSNFGNPGGSQGAAAGGEKIESARWGSWFIAPPISTLYTNGRPPFFFPPQKVR